MPFVEVEIVGEPPVEVRQGLARRLADSIGQAVGTRIAGTWVRVRVVSDGDYAESGGGPAAGSKPVFARLLLEETATGDLLRRRLEAITQAVAGACRRHQTNVHVILEPPAGGRVAFGGKLTESVG